MAAAEDHNTWYNQTDRRVGNEGEEMSQVMDAGTRIAADHGARKRVDQQVSNRVRRDGKFFRLGTEKFYIKGVTYGPFEDNADGHPLPSPAQAAKDFTQIRDLGGNTVRIYHTPPKWFLDLAEQSGLKIFLDVSWPKNLTFVDDEELTRQAQEAVRTAARACGNHPAVFAISVVNEVPSDIVRFVGAPKIAEFIDVLVDIAKAEAPQCLITFANYPTTEYLQPKNIDFTCFNVYLHDFGVFRNYMARLQNIAGEKPLVLGEYGIDTSKEKSEDQQAEILSNHVRAVFEEGAVGTFIFSYTDDWVVHNYRIEDWKFGLVRTDRSPKPAFEAVKKVFARVPQTADDKLPKVSVIICSYNGASTTQTCLASMEKLRYPDYEVIFVDDGSTDNTQEIVAKFPWVRNIKQKNMGLSYARNVGMNAALGEVIVYTDSDCEADEDWLYFLALALVRSGHKGMGGPNLIPDEGSWVADCVGLSPGGPTHVMINDREAEHVPGCNMAYYTWAAKEVNGFDPQYRAAGDDVDFIWRLQANGHSIGFSPAAQVWHYRRNTVKAYLKQQRGYGTAEALLKYKHPDHFNSLGASHWRGKIYGGEQIGVRTGGDVIYHGVFGTGLFQTIYRRPASMLAAMLMSIEWHLLTAFVFVLGLAFVPLLYVGLAMFMVPILLAAVAAMQSPMPKHKHTLTRPLIAYLHWRQPIARGWARYSVRLKNKIMKGDASGYRRPHALPFDHAQRDTLCYWSHNQDRIPLLQQITSEVQKAAWRMRVDSGWNDWDLEIYGSRYTKVRITTATEHHPSAHGMLTRVRIEQHMSKFCLVILVASLMLCTLLLVHIWPFSRPAVLVPMAVLAMYAVNRMQVRTPIFGLVDEAAETAGFFPIPTKVPSKVAKPRVAEEAELEEDEDGTPSIV